MLPNRREIREREASLSSHAAVEDEAADGVEVSLLGGVVEGQEGLLVERVGVAAGAQQQLAQLQVAPARRHVQDGVAVLNQGKRQFQFNIRENEVPLFPAKILKILIVLLRSFVNL